MQRSISIAIPFAAFICYCLLLAIVYWLGGRKRANGLFMLYLLTGAVWSLGSFMWRIQAPLFWNRVLITGVVGFPMTFFHFVRVFLGIRGQKYLLYCGYGLLCVILIANLMGYVTRDAYYEDGMAHYEIGPAAPFMGMYMYSYMALAMFYLVQRYFRTRDRLYRNRIQYPLLGLSLAMVASITNFVPEVGKYPIDIAASIINALLTAYAILRYHLLDITLVIRKGLAYSTLTVGIAAVYLLSIFVFERLASTVLGYGAYLVAALVAVILAVTLQPIRDRTQTWLDRLFFRQKYDAQQMLHRLGRTATTILDLTVLSEMLLEEVTTTMHITGACILLQEEETGVFYVAAQRGLASAASDVRLERDHPLRRWMAHEAQPLSADKTSILPQFKALRGDEKEDLDRLGAELYVPLLIKHDLVGILACGPKLSEQGYSQDDWLTLSTVADQTAIAVENARLYEAAQREIIEREWAEEQLRRYADELERSNQELQQFAYVASHDLQEPLRMVRSYMQLLARRYEHKLDADADEFIGYAVDGATRMQELIGGLLSYSRVGTHGRDFTSTDCEAVLERVLSNLRVAIEESGAVVSHDPLPEVTADDLQLGQMFQNLIANAIKFRGDEPPIVHVSAGHRDGQWLFSVRDNGIGIDPESAERLFKIFRRLHGRTEYPGTGIGLAICRRIVERHGGRIWVESQPGEGSTFYFTIPTAGSPV